MAKNHSTDNERACACTMVDKMFERVRKANEELGTKDSDYALALLYEAALVFGAHHAPGEMFVTAAVEAFQHAQEAFADAEFTEGLKTLGTNKSKQEN